MFARSSRRSARRPAGRGSSRCRRRPASRRRASRSRACAPRLHAAHADDRDADTRRDGRDLGQRDRADRRTRTARRCRRRATARRAPRVRAPSPRSVLISETASAPRRLGGLRDSAATSAVFGVSLTISGLAVSGPHARRRRARARAGSAPMSRPVSTFGQETFSSIAAISARSSQAPTSSASSSAVEPITFVISGTGQLGERGRSSAR